MRWERGSWLTISGLLPRARPTKAIGTSIEKHAAAASGSRWIPKGSGFASPLTAEPDIVKVNIAEAGGAPGVPTASPGRLPAAASKIRDMAGTASASSRGGRRA